MARESWVQTQVESYQRLKKWFSMPPCLTLSILRYGSRVKWSNPGNGVASFPTPWCIKLSKREYSGHPRRWSPTLLYIYIYIYINTKVKVRSPDGDIDYIDIVTGVLQGDTFVPYLFIICLDYVLRTFIDKMKENGFKLTKERSRRYPAETITDPDYADDIALLANAPDQAQTLLHSVERTAAVIGLHAKAHNMEYMCFNQRSDISTQNGCSLKLVDRFTYLGSCVTSTVRDINTWLA